MFDAIDDDPLPGKSVDPPIPVNSLNTENQHLKLSLNPYARKCYDISKRKGTEKQQQFSVSLIAAISQDRVIAHQVLEGGIDSVIFENFVY